MVVITGAGILTSMGKGWAANADGFQTGRVALRDVTLFDVSKQRAKRGGELDLPASPPNTSLTSRQESRLDRATEMVLHASDEALHQAGWEHDGLPFPICLGTSAGAMPIGESFYRQAIATPKRRRGQPTRVHHYQPQRQAALLSDAFELNGQATLISNACASGANAIGHAKHLIQTGQAERVLTGGYDALAQMVFAGFDSLQALSPTQPRPFDRDRDGLALGEGAGMFVVETLASAEKRGARILAEVAGYGAATDVHHLTQPQPDGDAALASMNAACQDAQLYADDIGYINSHGTGTPLNDSAEANAILRWAGEERVGQIKVSSTKAGIGHLLGGAGAVEAVISLMALTEGWVPPETVVREIDPVVRFELVREPSSCSLDAVLTNSFGFGGANATVILKRFES